MILRKVRLKDVAKRANVSPTTVSLVLNNKEHRISTEKQEEIIRIANELDYRPNYLARSLSMQRTQTVAMLIPDIENPFFSSLARYVVKNLSFYDYHTFLAISEDSYLMEKNLIKKFEQREVDGFILCLSNESYHYEEEMNDFLKSINKPVVLVDRIFEKKQSNQIYFDNFYGGYLATKYLIDKGSQRLLCLTGDLTTFNASERYKGYLSAIEQYGESIQKTYVVEGDYRFTSGYEKTKEVIEDCQIDGVFAFNDLMAFGSMRAIEEVSRTSLEKVHFVGYDNLSTSDVFDIHLSSIDQNIEEISNLAAEMLVNIIETGEEQKEIVLKPNLNIREKNSEL